jgi:hypothetical protein
MTDNDCLAILILATFTITIIGLICVEGRLTAKLDKIVALLEKKN